jgi:hypothetical protein
MDKHMIDNMYTIVFIIILFSASYIYISVTKNKKEMFNDGVPGPAAIMKQPPPVLPPRQVSPSGPNPPNARIPEMEQRKLDVLNVIPSDPYDETYGSQNMKDNLRRPERSFSPGIMNDGHNIFVRNGVASEITQESERPIQHYSQEMVQNGGNFNDSYGPNDTSDYAAV